MIPLQGIAQICNISVPATMVDATTGKFIPTIQPAMLHARINKDFLRVSEVERIRNFRVLLLVDGSGSMSVEGGAVLNKKETVQHIKEILDENLDHLPDGVQVAFGIFNKQVVFGNEFTSDPDRLHHIIPETIARLKSAGRGSTALLDAIHQGLAQFTPGRPGDTIVLLTDGEDNVSTHISEKELARELSRKGVRLFVLWVKISYQRLSPGQQQPRLRYLNSPSAVEARYTHTACVTQRCCMTANAHNSTRTISIGSGMKKFCRHTRYALASLLEPRTIRSGCWQSTPLPMAETKWRRTIQAGLSLVP